jgi:hypothetical protein
MNEIQIAYLLMTLLRSQFTVLTLVHLKLVSKCNYYNVVKNYD